MAAPNETATQSATGSDGESALVAKLRAGDDEAYEQLVRTHAGMLLAVARRLLAREEDARDAVQEAFLSAFKSIDRFEGGSRLSTWLHRIVVNACLMKRRSDKRRPTMSIESLLPAFQGSGEPARPGVRDGWRTVTDNGVASAEERGVIHDAIDQLPEPYRDVLMLRDIEELDTEQTALYLGITEGAVKTRLHRARQALRELLDPYFREIRP